MKLVRNPMDPINTSFSFWKVLDWLASHDFPDRVWLSTSQYSDLWIRLGERPPWGDDIRLNRTHLGLKVPPKDPEEIDVSTLENWGCE